MSKNRKQKMVEYEMKYGHIPKDYRERLVYMYETMKMNDTLSDQVLEARQQFINGMYYQTIHIVLYEIPQFTPRPRARIVNKAGMINAVNGGNSFIQIYSITGRDNKEFMRVFTRENIQELEQLLCTPCDLEINAYFPTPKTYNRVDTFMAEIGLMRPVIKPDFDNIEKSYADAFSENIWIDDILVVDSALHKYYSILPRVEINLKYANRLYNIHQYKSMTNRKDFLDTYSVDYFKYTP